MIKKFDAYFIDLDGTTFDKNHNDISIENINAIKKKSKEAHVIVSTGRPLNVLIPIMKELNSEYGIAQNGAIIVDKTGKIIYDKTITGNNSKKIINYIIENNIPVKVNEDLHFYNPKLITKIFVKKYKFSWKSNYNGLIENNDKYRKILICGYTKYKIKKIKSEIESFNIPLSIVQTVNGWLLEITSHDATKGIASKWLCENKLNVNYRNAVHIGDTMNDISAFKILGHGIAMKNSNKKVKSYANWIGPHYKNAGLSKILLENNFAKNKN